MMAGTPQKQEKKIRSLTARADFLRLRQPKKIGGYSYSSPAFLLQGAPSVAHSGAEPGAIRFGLIVTKKMGNAVCRNRIKRRLRAGLNHTLPLYGRPGYDYVLVARQAALRHSFASMLDDMKQALVRPGDADPAR